MAADKLTIIYSLFNKHLFSEAKANIDKLELSFKNDMYASNNPLIKSLIDLIKTRNYEDIVSNTFDSVLASESRTVDEINFIKGQIIQFQGYNKSQIEIFREQFKKLCYGGYVNQLNFLYSNDPVALIEKSKEFDYISTYSEKLTVKQFSELDIETLAKEYEEGGMTSSFNFINEASPIKKYIPGQLVQVVAPPGVGKSLFLQQEAVHFVKDLGKKGYYLVMGDLDELDMTIRMSAIAFHKNLGEVSRNVVQYYNQLNAVMIDKFKFSVTASGSVAVEEVVDLIKASMKDVDFVMIDYDSNFKHSNESMYLDGGSIYDKLTELSKIERKLVFVASQPQRSYFREEFIPGDGSGESTRKYHISDMVITIGRNPSSKLRMGIMNLGKNRRGEISTQKWIASSDGRLLEVDEVTYATHRNDQNHFSLTEGELAMEGMKTDNLINQAIAQQGGNVNNSNQILG